MNLNITLKIISIFLLLTLSACSQDEKEYNFYGASNNWVVKYETEISESRGWSDFSFEYIGEEPPPSTFRYNLKGDWFELSSTEQQFNHPNKNINSGNSECTGPPTNSKSCKVSIEEGTKLEAVIEWNETFEPIVLEMR